MFITFDYRCRQCGKQETRFVRRKDMDRQFCIHEGKNHASDQLMDRLPPATRTTFRYADTNLKR